MRGILITCALAIVLLGGAGAGRADAKVDPLRGVQWALDAIHLGGPTQRPQPSASAPGADGDGVVVAVVDSGVEATHPDLQGRVLRGPDFVDNDGLPDDPNGHGTHIAGIIAAAAGNGIGGAGVAPRALILAIRVLDEHNSGGPVAVAAGIDAATAAGADVINLSLNWSSRTAALAPVTAAMQRAADAGIAVIIASGNDAQPRCEEPYLPDRTLCVGAVDGDRQIAPFSSHGDGLGIVAPGSDILSTWRGGDYVTVSGTSQAAAVASGVAALLVGLGLRGQAVIDRLEQTARDIGAPGLDPAYGHGLLDAQRALEGAEAGTFPAILRIAGPADATIAGVRRGGLKVSCDAARAGACGVRVRIGASVVAKGTVKADGTGAVDAIARLTEAGRKRLRGARSRTVVVEATLDGAPGARTSVRLRGR